MVQFIAGEKGSGKTKKLLDMANEAAKTTDGHIVFIDNNRRYMYDLHYDIRFVETGGYPLSNYREFIGFICGILSQNSDIKEIFVDSITHIIKTVDAESISKLVKKLEALSAENSVNFIVSINCNTEDLPEDTKKLLI